MMYNIFLIVCIATGFFDILSTNLGMQFGGVLSTSQVANNFIGTGLEAGFVGLFLSAIFRGPPAQPQPQARYGTDTARDTVTRRVCCTRSPYPRAVLIMLSKHTGTVTQTHRHNDTYLLRQGSWADWPVGSRQ